MDPKDIEAFKEAFFMLDRDGDGKISWEELGYVMKMLGHKVSETQLKQIMQMIDENGNGVIDYQEFTDILLKTRRDSTDDIEELKEAFKVFDLDGDGIITAKELGIVMQSLGQKLSENEVTEMIKEADSNSDGRVDFEEFVQMMSKKVD